MSIPKASTATRKIQIEQSVPTGSIRKGPYAIERSVDASEVVIKRRFGEGSKPLFQRDDIVVNPNSVIKAADSHTENHLISESKNRAKDVSNQYLKGSLSSTDSSSPEGYRKYHTGPYNDCTTSTNNRSPPRTKPLKSTNEGKHTIRCDSSPPFNHRRRTPEKLPYFQDETRERDRLRRKYETKPKIPSSSPPLSSRSRQRRSRSKSRSRSQSREFEHRLKYTNLRRSVSTDRYIGETGRRDRGSRSDKTSSRYPHRSEDRSKSDRRQRHWRSPSRSPRRSRDRLTRSRKQSRHDERHKNYHSEHGGASSDELAQRNLPQPQIITIPVPVPADFMNYTYPTWPTQWNPPMAHPVRYGPPAAYHIPTILPAAVMPPMRPPLPPYGPHPPPLRYGVRGFRLPPQYGASRPWRPKFRTKNT
ncbi:female-specific protein transformer isoform X1 [Anastrepha obliqua]|uniref:female-specific protein transformer isoform X1 n=1 Tax=Anastrepha obliqua TaxID=95512 RepID=UPI0024097A75|nr:female-specific protein transformer isoform X1 [Anastrepha obliqua]XP_054732529.1 female-specific protein transformer isoform X1 [Anastrepha obliqua]